MNQRERIERHIRSGEDRYLSLLEKMVAVNSFTLNPEGVNALGALTADEFAALGLSAEFVQAADSQYGKHLLLQRGDPAARSIVMISHLDTVYPAAEEQRADFRWRRSGNRIYGPGTIDIKGGTMMIYIVLDAVRALYPELFESVRWVVCLNAAEEHLVEDFTPLVCSALGPAPVACLVFEADESPETDCAFTMVTARKGYADIVLEASGRNSHSGAAHPQGANAIHQIAEIIPQLERMTDYERDLTINVGVIRGGEAPNRVPSGATVRMEARAFEDGVLREAVDAIRGFDGYSTIRAAADGFPCAVSVQVQSIEAPWPVNRGTEELLRVFQGAAADLGLSVQGAKRGGLSDGNRLWQRAPTIDGLGPAGDNAHCAERSEDGSRDQEYLWAPSVVPKALLIVTALLRLLEQDR